MQTIDVLVILEIDGLEDSEKFEKLLKRKSFKAVQGEEFVYTSSSTTTLITTKTYILQIFKEALEKAVFKDAKLVFLLNETSYPPYIYDKSTKEFEISEENKEEK